MTQHPIGPPPDKIHNWIQLEKIGWSIEQIIALATQWGADTELEACCEWLHKDNCSRAAHRLYDARRPKPPSLKRVALLQLDVIAKDLTMHGLGCDLSQIRRALESIPDHASEGGFNG